MALNGRRRKVRGESAAIDTLHIVIAIIVVVLAVASFLSPEEHMLFFPVIFLLAALLNLVSGRYHLGRGKDHGQKIAAVLQMIFGLAFLILAVISAISIWWR